MKVITETEKYPIIDATCYDGIHLIVFDFIERRRFTNCDGSGVIDEIWGKAIYGFRQKKKIKPIVFKSTSSPEQRSHSIDFSFLKFWKWI